MAAIRYVGGIVLGVGACFAVWLVIATAHPIFRELGPSGLVPAVGAGIVGGLVSGVFAPRYKVAFAAAVGFAVTVLVLGYLITHIKPPGGNPLVSYWPGYLLPSFVVGGILSRCVESLAFLRIYSGIK